MFQSSLRNSNAIFAGWSCGTRYPEKDGRTSVEHHWLCGLCYRTYDFEFRLDGAVTLKEKTSAEHADELHFGNVILPERRRVKRAPGASRGPNIDGKVA